MTPRNRLTYIILGILQINLFSIYAQTTFNKTFNFENNREEIASIIQHDNSYYFVGMSAAELGVNKTKLTILKTNVDGIFEDSLTFLVDTFSFAMGRNVGNLLFLDDTLLISSVIQFENSIDNQDGVIVKVKDFNSTPTYLRYEIDSADVFMTMFNSNQDLRIFGSTRSFGNGSSDYYLINTNTSGVLLKDTTFGGTDFEQIGNAIRINSNHYVFSGINFTDANPRQHFVVQAGNAQFIAIDSNYNVLWNTVLYSPGVDELPMVKDFGFFYSTIEYPILPPPRYRDDFVHLIGRIDVNTGSVIWMDTVRSQENIIQAGYIEVGDSNTFYIFSRVEVSDLPYSIVKITKYNGIGEVVWERLYYEGNHNGCYLNSMIIDEDGYLVFGGTIANLESQSQDFWMLKLRPDGCLDDTDCGLVSGIIDLTPPSNLFKIKVYPNPSANFTNIIIENTGLYKNELLEIIVTDMNGRIIQTEKQSLDGQIPMFHVDVSDLPSGAYIVQSKVKNKILGNSQFIVK